MSYIKNFIKFSQKNVNDIFSSVANEYDLMNDLMSLGLHRTWKKKFVDLIIKQVHFDRLQALNRNKKFDYNGSGTLNANKRQVEEVSFGDFCDKIDDSNGPGALNYNKKFDSNGSETLNTTEEQILGVNFDNYNNSIDEKIFDNSYYAKLIDVACGSCDISLEILKLTKDDGFLKLTCSDINQNMLDRGKEKLINAGFFDFDTVLSDASKFPFKDESFQYYTISFGARNIKSADFGLKEAYRILKPGGTFFCMEFGRPDFWIKNAYDYYSKFVIPTLGQLIAKNKSAYEYLVQSIEDFPPPNIFLDIIKSCGFIDTKIIKLNFGIVNIYIAKKAQKECKNSS